MATAPTIEQSAEQRAQGYRLPPRFIQDCLECDCDVGDYDRGVLTATPAQLAELVSRASHYADVHGPDAAPPGLKVAAKAVLVAIAKVQS